MAARFVAVDRQTPLCLPCELREWLPDDHLVQFILDAVEHLALPPFRVSHRSSGGEPSLPAMMRALLLCSNATGHLGARTIEAATPSDVAVRCLCAHPHPDHASICAFRANPEAAFRTAFVRVLELVKELRVAKLGGASVGGTSG